VKRISWTIIAALVATLFLPVSAAQAGTTTEACVSGSAILSYPRPMAIDQSGNLFFVDQNNFVIRKVLRGSRSVVNVTFDDSSVAGRALKNELQSYRGGNMRLGLDASGNLFIAVDSGWNLVNFVFKLAPSGIVSVVAGTGTDGYTGDGGLATAAKIHDPSGLAVDDSGNIYISDNSENVIRKINASDGKINTVVGPGATFPELINPGSLAIDSTGQLFIATGNGLILKRTVAGNVSIFAGSEGSPISARKIAVGGNGTVSFLNGNAIYQINSSTKVITKIAGDGGSDYPGNSLEHRLGTPHSIAVDTSGNIYVSDSNQFLIKKIDPLTLTISNYAGVPRFVSTGYRYIPTDGTKATYANYRYTHGLAASSNGDIYFSSSDNYNTVVKASKSTGLITNIAGDLTGNGGFTADGATAAGAKLDNPGSVAIDALGNVYFLDLGNNRLRKIKVSDGKIITIAGTGTSGYSASDVSAASSPITSGESDKIAVDSLGNVYLTDNTNHVIRKITAGANPTISNIASGIAVITGLSVDSVNNFLYFSTESAIKKINISSSSPTVTSVATLTTHFVRALAIDPATQTLYYANESPQNTRTIGKILNASTSQTTLLAGPTSLVAGGGSTGYVSAGAPATSVRLGSQIELAFSSGTSTLYVGHEFNGEEGQWGAGYHAINVSAGTISTFAGVPLDGPAPLCVEYEVVPTITAGNNGAQAAAIPATASSAVFSSPSILNTTLKFTSTSATASATVTPVSSNPASSTATPFQIKGSTKIVDIQVTGITGPVAVCLDGAPTDSIFHFTGGAWVELPGKSYANGQVCGVTSSFSPFTAAEPAVVVGGGSGGSSGSDLPGLVPTFSAASSLDYRFTVKVANYDSAYTYTVTASPGTATISSTGLVTVTNLGLDANTTVTVTTTRTGYQSASASIGGRSQVAAMVPSDMPVVTTTATSIMCTMGVYSAKPTSAAFSLFVDGKHVSTSFSSTGEYLPDWIIPWATSSTITRTASLTSASWTLSDAYKGKAVTCTTLAYSKNAIGFTSSKAITAP
jgi:sugar lactone lactonase YvrE